MKKRTVAVIGAGLAGLAVAWHCLEKGFEVVVYDENGIAGGASGVAAGLMHMFAGRHAKRNKLGEEGYAAARRLFQVAEQACGQSIVQSKGLLRVAVTEEQESDFRRTADSYPEQVSWMPPNEFPEGVRGRGGIFIADALSVDILAYLRGLWKACEARGGQLVIQKIDGLDEIKAEKVFVCTGASLDLFKEAPITQVKGQLLELEWPNGVEALPYAINSDVYVVMRQNSCLVGATFEKRFDGLEADLRVAEEYIRPRLMAFYPVLENAKVLGCYAGMRASTPGHLPLIQKVASNCWALVGLGSRGLLYHGLFAERLVTE